MGILEYTFFQNALLGSLLASIVCGYIGTYIVTRRLVFISGGISHASFGGIGIGLYLGVNPILSAMLFAIASAFGIQWLSRDGQVREDSAIAVCWTFGMSVGIICCFLTPGFMPDLSSYLFGNILTIGTSDLLLLSAVALAVVLLFARYSKSVINVAFDPVFSKTIHLPVTWIESAMMALIAITIVAILRMVGIVLAISLLTVPQMTANLFTYRFRRMILYSTLFGCADCACGLMISYYLNVPSGAAIIFMSILVYFLLKGVMTVIKHHQREKS